MKSIFTYISALLLLAWGQASGQSCLQPCAPLPLVIDISTGIDDNGQLIPVLSPDDDWSVKPAPNYLNPSPVYQPAYCGTGKCETPCSNPPCNSPTGASYGSPWINSSWGWGSGLDPRVRWIAPYINSYGHHISEPWYNWGEHCGAYNFQIGQIPQNCATSYYKMNFNLAVCSAQTAVLNFTYIGADNKIDTIFINGNPHAVNYVFTPVNTSPPLNVFTTNASVTVPIGELNQNGQNTIVIKVWNLNTYTGLIINGNLTIQADAYVDFDLKDKNDLTKTEFCFGEDIFLDGSNMSSNSYFMELWEVNGSTATWLALQSANGWAAGSPNWLNVTDIFENSQSTFTFQSNKTYRVKLALNTTCGWREVTKDFKYICCTNSTDASFSLTTQNGSVLVGKSNSKGNHEWKVYSTPNVNTGPYTAIGTYTNATLSLNLAQGTGPCYYVMHKLTNDCGEECTSQSICDVACDEGDCHIDAPTGLSFNSTTKELSWSPVNNAASYIIEIAVCDPACCTGHFACPGNNGPIMHPPVIKTISVQDISYILNYSTDLGLDIIEGEVCFSWKVIAICPNGSTSMASTTVCTP